MTEEERATHYREQCVARLAFKRQQAALLAGDVEARAELEERWEPLIDALSDWRANPQQPKLIFTPRGIY